MRMTESEKKALRREYLEEFPECQYSAALKGNEQWPFIRRGPVCVEHIWNRKGPDSEHWSNYATVWNVPGGPHAWKEQHSIEGRIVITAFKYDLMLETGDERHFDLEVLKKCSGYYIPSWVEWKMQEYGDRLPEFVVEAGQSFLERFEALRSA
mgnify:FL=1